MDENNAKAAIQSRTMLYILSALIAYLVKNLGLPMLPADVNGELVWIIQMGLSLFIPFALVAAMHFRKKATEVLDRWF
jgi:hypothetical protein